MLVYVAARLACEWLDRGLKPNYPEAVSVIADHVAEGARDGRTAVELMQSGRQVLRADQALDGVPEVIHDVQVEAGRGDLPGRTKLVTVHDPVT
ncbi:urease subunit gamma [Saccharopolyspora sp. ASAGF58]|nr:urease subunit gamma [Saccharopolyspora sp. ASAGF58]